MVKCWVANVYFKFLYVYQMNIPENLTPKSVYENPSLETIVQKVGKNQRLN